MISRWVSPASSGLPKNHAVQVDELVTRAARRRVELCVQPLELSLGAGECGFETRQLGFAVVTENAVLR